MSQGSLRADLFSRLGGSLILAMAAGTFTAAILSVLGPFIVEDFAISHAALGAVVAVNTLFGAVVSPTIGRYVDRIGGRSGVATVLVTSATAFFATAAAPMYVALLLASLVGGISQALSNPATNKVIAHEYPAESRADITGLKQSGVQVAIFIGGVTLPTVAERFGWRAATVAVGVGILILGVLLGAIGPQPPSGGSGVRGGAVDRPQGAVPWLAAYGATIGFSSSGLFFLPLFATDELGTSVQIGGLALAVAGITAVVGRLGWARFSERGGRYRLALGVIAALAVIGPLLFLLADSQLALLWIGAVVVGASASSWNSVGMLAVIDDARATGAGTASGWVLSGFLLGLGIGPPLLGATFDATGSYTAMWWLTAATAGLALAVIVAWHWRSTGASRMAQSP